MGTLSSCRWIELKKLPPGITDAKQLPWTVVTPAKAFDERAGMLIEAIVKDIVLQGEDVADAVAISLAGQMSLAEYDGVTYGLFLHDDYNRIYQMVCGVRAELPWMIVGGLAGGIGGFVVGNKVMGQSLMGSAVGILVGTAGGYAVRRLAE